MKSEFLSSGRFDVCSITMSLVGSHERRGRICFYVPCPHTTNKSVSSTSSCLCDCAIWVFVSVTSRHLCPAVLTFCSLALGIEYFQRWFGEKQDIRPADLPSVRATFSGNSPPRQYEF